MRIHDPISNDTEIPTPENWPDINVSGFQEEFSIDDKVAPVKLVDVLTLAVAEVIDHLDPLQVVLPMSEVNQVHFRQAVYFLAYAGLMPSLAVNTQHKSEPLDRSELKERITFYEDLSRHHQLKLPGFIQQYVKPSFSSELL